MERHHRTQIILGVISLIVLLFILYAARCYLRVRWQRRRRRRDSCEEAGKQEEEEEDEEEGDPEAEDLICFPGGEDLTVNDILEAPGEVVGKSSYGTLYQASIQRSGAVALLRFVRPASVGRVADILPAVRFLGLVRHPNLVPLCALYVGNRGEKLFVHPFYAAGNLSHFLRDGNAESQRWEVIHELSLGIARGLEHLHIGMQRPIVHGNLKAKNVLLDANYQPRLSDFGIHLLLNPTTGQEMLDASATQGYKAPELIKMKDASRESDIYSLGVILLEMVTRKEPSDLLGSQVPRQPASLRTLLLEHRLSDLVRCELINQSQDQSSRKDEVLLMFFQLAMACCSPTPALRPDIKEVVRKLEEIGWCNANKGFS